MNKKYRLEINYSEVTEENFIWVERMREKSVDGEICKHHTKEGEYYFEKQDVFFEIPKSWLTKITEPLTYEEWDEQQNFGILEPSANQRRNAWIDGITNDHLRMKQTLDSAKKEYFDNHCNGDDAYRIQVGHVWNSIVAILNLDQEPTDDNT